MTIENGNPAPSRRGRGPALLVLVALGGAVVGGGGALLATRRGHEAPAVGAKADVKPRYQCPMHPTIVQDHPGDCPICGMKLVPMADAGVPPAAAPASAPAGGGSAQKTVRYQCPMHPTVVQDHPGDCPICGMKLVRMDDASAPAAPPKGERKIAFYRSPMDAKQTSPTPRKDEMGMDYVPVYEDELHGSAAVEGLAAVNIDSSRQQLIGLRTAKAERGRVGGSWRTVGKVAVDETRVHRVNVKVAGFVDRVEGDFVGKPVRKGQPLFSIYSPELLSAQEEYLLAARTRKTLGQGGPMSGDGDALVLAARRKLELWDVPAPEIARMERTGEATKYLTFFAPATGVITKKDVVPGARVNAGDTPFEIVDLGHVWVLADVYESELRHVKVGMPATLTLNAYPNRTFRGRVAFIDPVLDPKSRTVRVRIDFANPSGELKPEMFGEVVLQGAARDGLRIPADAVIDSGTRKVVFVALGDGKFQPREVKLGDSDGRDVEVVSGIAGGDEVVTRANFLVDSESRLRASLAAMSGPPATPVSAGTGATGGATPPAAPADQAGHAGKAP